MRQGSASAPRGARVGVDVGGTFTDIVVTDATGAIHTGKLPSTPEDFSTGVSDGVRQVLGIHDVDPQSVRDVVHGSTVATNAILERKGTRTGLLTTAGFGDVLELRRLRMPKLYDMTWEKPTPLVERCLRREVPERVDVDGTEVDDAGHRVAGEQHVIVPNVAQAGLQGKSDPGERFELRDGARQGSRNRSEELACEWGEFGPVMVGDSPR